MATNWVVYVVLPSLMTSLPPEREQEALAAARSLLGTSYEFGGRLRRGEGVDCQGVVFHAAEMIGPCGWRSFSTKPSRSIANGELGVPVAGLDPVATQHLDIGKLEPGDIVRLIDFTENPRDASIGVLRGRPVWPWHSGMYTGNGNWIVGDHYAGEVVEEPLLPYLRRHRDAYLGVHVTRMRDGPAPMRCRIHVPMKSRRR